MNERKGVVSFELYNHLIGQASKQNNSFGMDRISELSLKIL